MNDVQSLVHVCFHSEVPPGLLALRLLCFHSSALKLSCDAACDDAVHCTVLHSHDLPALVVHLFVQAIIYLILTLNLNII